LRTRPACSSASWPRETLSTPRIEPVTAPPTGKCYIKLQATFRAAGDARMETAAMAAHPAARGPGFLPALPRSRPATCSISSQRPAERIC
jgi:hypothetical protein